MALNHRILIVLLILSVLLTVSGCQPNGSYIVIVTATPGPGSAQPSASEDAAQPEDLPTGLSPTVDATPTYIPTPDPTRQAVLDPTEDQLHVVRSGETLGNIAAWYGVSIYAIVQANGLANENILEIGQNLLIPTAVKSAGTAFKIIPDSELVYGPTLEGFSVIEFVNSNYPDSYLAHYSEDLNGYTWSGVEIIDRVSLEQSINPRLLLALLEYENGWLSKRTLPEAAVQFPLNYAEYPGRIYGLYRQLDWAAKILQFGYYGWRLRGLAATLTYDGTRVGLDPALNAGTAAVQVMLGQTRSYTNWLIAISSGGFFKTYTALFDDPFRSAADPLLPPDLQQPEMSFPWDASETWYFTGGAHGGWGSGSAWAALDFVPSETVDVGCTTSPKWARAVADGVIARSEYGIVVLDLDGDGFEGTGWTVFYLHLSSEDRAVTEGQRVKKGDPIGHPACEGGVSYATHLHIGRRYNGEWIPADCTECEMAVVPAPQLDFDGWLAYTFGSEYDGSLIKGDGYREACACRADFNTFTPADVGR